jgi:predicted DNA-binding transcriptional regulator AlpA
MNDIMDNEETADLLSTRRLAQVLDCSPKTVQDWMYKDRKNPATDPLPYYRIGGLVRFKLSEVRRWINRRRVRIAAVGKSFL